MLENYFLVKCLVFSTTPNKEKQVDQYKSK